LKKLRALISIKSNAPYPNICGTGYVFVSYLNWIGQSVV